MGIYEKMVEGDRQRDERADEKEQRRENWHRTKNPVQRLDGEGQMYEAPLIINCTTDSRMKDEMRKICVTFREEYGMDVKVLERGEEK